jgi:hypothetical protein
LGFFLRTVDIDAASLYGDEAWIMFKAFSFGHLGQRHEIGPFYSTGLVQPPILGDVFAIPFAFDPDPRFARLFMGAIHVVSMGVLYLMVRRYWSTRTALAALLLYAIMPRAIWIGREIWQPNFVPPFLIGYFATGFLATEGKRWARWLHPIMLCLAMQAHLISVLFAPLTLGFLALDWRKAQLEGHWRFLLDYVGGSVVAAMLLVPWAIGLGHFQANNPTRAIVNLAEVSAPDRILSYLIDNPTRLYYKIIPNADYQFPPQNLTTFFQVIGWITLLGSIFLIGRALLQRSHFADAMISASYLILPGVLLLFPQRTYNHYMIPLLPAAAVIQAIVLIGSRPRSTHLLRLALVAIIVIGILQVSVVFDTIRQFHTYNTFTRGQMPSLEEVTEFRNQAVRPDVETIYLLEGYTDAEFTLAMAWSIHAAKGPSRVIWGDNMALPVPEGGATYVGYFDAIHIPELYAQPTPRLTIHNLYKVVDLPPHSGFEPTCRPEGPTRLGNGATILGFYTPGERMPRPGQPWTVYVLWRSKVNTSGQSFQLFNHLVESSGTAYAKRDIGTLATDLWRENELLVSKVTLQIAENLPTNEQLTLNVGMYRFPDVKNTSVLDSDGNPVAAWVRIPLC